MSFQMQEILNHDLGSKFHRSRSMDNGIRQLNLTADTIKTIINILEDEKKKANVTKQAKRMISGYANESSLSHLNFASSLSKDPV